MRRSTREVVSVFFVDRYKSEIPKMKAVSPAIPSVPRSATYPMNASVKPDPAEATTIYGNETTKIPTHKVSEAKNFPIRKSFMESGERKRLSAVSFSNSVVMMDEASMATMRSATPMMI